MGMPTVLWTSGKEGIESERSPEVMRGSSMFGAEND